MDSKGIKRAYGVLGRLVLASAALLSVFSAAWAEDESEPATPSTFTVNGFGTLGAARSTTDEVSFVRDLTQARGVGREWSAKLDSLLGVQANWRVTPQLEAVVQAVSKYRYDRSFTPDISWAFVKYDLMPNLSLRAGRLGTEFFMLADSRQIGYSYLPVRPPGDYFWYLPFANIDGGDATLTLPAGDALVRGKVFYGLAQGKIPLADKQWDIRNSPMVGGYVETNYGGWQLRASYANIEFSRDLPIDDVLLYSPAPAAAAKYVATKDTRSHYYSIGAVYDSGPWQLQLLINHIEQGSNAFESSDGGYALAGYRIGEFTPYLGYSWVQSYRRGNPSGDPVVGAVMADSHAVQRTSIVGVRWDVVRNVALKAQWDGIRAQPTSLFPYRDDPRGGSWSGKADIFSLTMDFIF